MIFKKMMDSSRTAILLILMFLISCGTQSIHEEFKSFENDSWSRFDDQHFEYEIENTGSKYTLKLILVLDEDIKHNTIPFDTRIATPGGEERLMSHKLHLNRQEPDEENFAGENKQSFSVYLLKDHTFNKKGLVKIDVQNRMPVTRITGVHEIGIRVTKK